MKKVVTILTARRSKIISQNVFVAKFISKHSNRKIIGKINKISGIGTKTFTPGHYGIDYSQMKSSTIYWWSLLESQGYWVTGIFVELNKYSWINHLSLNCALNCRLKDKKDRETLPSKTFTLVAGKKSWKEWTFCWQLAMLNLLL